MFEVYLVGNNSHHFIISPTSVQGKADIRIRVAIPLDYETVDRYNFDLFANESVPDHVGYAKVKITLINENDNRPIFSQPLYNVSLYENVTVGTSVLTVLVSPLSLTGQLSSGVNHQEASRGILPKECGQLGERGRGYPQALRGCGVGVLEHPVSS